MTAPDRSVNPAQPCWHNASLAGGGFAVIRRWASAHALRMPMSRSDACLSNATERCPSPPEEVHMKHVKTLLWPALLSAALASGGAYAQSEPSIALPPAEVILKAAADMGVEVVNTDYVLSKLPQLLGGSGQVFVIDARPGRNYDEGHVPTAYNIYDAKFKLLYPAFEKLGIAKDAEIFLGIGRPCPMSLNNIKLLKEQGYTNLKAFVKGPVYFERSYFEVTAKGAKKAAGNGARIVDLNQDPGLTAFLSTQAPKDQLVVLVGQKASSAANYAAAAKVYGAGYLKAAVFNGDVAEIQ
jgi:rhodanese-related sulfurtransferase